MEELKCKKCGGKIEFDECFEMEHDDDTVYRCCSGQCSKCDTEYTWTEKYKLASVCDLEEEGF